MRVRSSAVSRWASAAGCIVLIVLVVTPAFAQKVVINHNIFGPPRAVTAGIEAMAEFYRRKYVTEDIAMSGFMCFQGISLTTWNEFPEPMKAKVQEARQLATQALIKAYKEADAKWIPIFKEKLGSHPSRRPSARGWPPARSIGRGRCSRR